MIYPSFKHNVTVTLEADQVLAKSSEGELKSHLQLNDEKGLLSTSATQGELYLRTLEFIFGTNVDLLEIQVEGANEVKKISREEFFQTPNLWHVPKYQSSPAEKWNRSVERPHPFRDDRKSGLFYQRFAANIGKTITFRGVDPVADVDTFHNWQNQPRVSFFWELAKPKEELTEYLTKTKADPHMIPTFVEFDGRPVGYFEMYWTMEDRLGPYYEADAFDRGFHFLIGDASALGFANTDSIVKSALHFLFLDDPRSRRVMAEPRSDNKKVLRYASSSGWTKLKEFDFPHKRAALLECKRENFFNGERL